MTNISTFESRTGYVEGRPEDIYRFVTDIRNFERFIPGNSITGFVSEKESCSFSVSMIGTVSVRITEKVEFSRVVFDGDALKKEDFRLTLHIDGSKPGESAVRVSVEADLNPMLKMMASRPLEQFLEMLVTQMEKFKDWRNIRE
jgi:carbon monoxide dehydrogenase subunit G